MKAFGLEIRKANSLAGVYSDVDRVLAKFNIPSGGISADVQVLTVAHALQKMMEVGSFCNVCTIKECSKITQTFIHEERMRIYQAAHCIHWNAMTDEYRAMLFAMILDDFRHVLHPQI